VIETLTQSEVLQNSLVSLHISNRLFQFYHNKRESLMITLS